MIDEKDLKDPILPLGRPTVASAGETGEWRAQKRPRIILENCVKCYRCWQHCPEVAISIREEDGYPEVDYRYCKGCFICMQECPKDAIVEESE